MNKKVENIGNTYTSAKNKKKEEEEEEKQKKI